MAGKVMHIALAFLSAACISARADGDAQEVPLRQQLEGLGPEPRIAYLEHLLRERGPDPELYFLLGVAFHEASRTDSALFYYTKSLTLDSSNTKAYVNLGVLYDERGNTRRALEMFELAVAIDPGDVLALAHAAFIHFQRGGHEIGWEYLSRALRIDPGNAQLHFYLAIFFWESGIYREAMREWESVIELEPGGYLADKARENIVLLQKALRSPTRAESWRPGR